MAMGVENGGHESSPLRRGVLGIGQFWHEDVRILDLDRCWYAAHHPVLDTLGTAALVNCNQLCNLGRPAKAADQIGIMRGCSHGVD